ncbi:hypothetical protein [Streptomyces sp. CMB-StM0423]|uniref:hypothetical protein n=1 Tax=Streptomyces sp. CMB-StM0423 TaxID=2059884 RepID=UPI0018FE48C9
MGVFEVGVLVGDKLGAGGGGDDREVGFAYGFRRKLSRGSAGGGIEEVAAAAGEHEDEHGGQVLAQPGGDVVPGEHRSQHTGGGRERGRGQNGNLDGSASRRLTVDRLTQCERPRSGD